ncbi:c-type cytochrome [Limibaculum sp. M0105]|uniref:C-type cytochrome n=1 Tax=Thermohalobaculum xanthum TaxID=2753746 RepID=A0A8J7M8P0_9RHOB|nr:c-type cytochrome [Thermohalobaculum xanthum]MBK0400654.1 c-type cytochrome [Thermohalobaculum xanthum]
MMKARRHGQSGARPWVAALAAGAALCAAGRAPAQDLGDAVAPYVVVNGREIPESLTGAPGDPARGLTLFLDATRTGCTACHVARAASSVPAGGYGTGGSAPRTPDGRDPAPLDGVAARLSPGEIRLWIVDPAAVDPSSAMPAYYLPGQRKGVDDPLYNGPRLTAAQIEDLVAWLATLDAAP